MAEAAFRLVVKTGPNPGTTFDLTKEVTLVGRDVTNEIGRASCRERVYVLV